MSHTRLLKWSTLPFFAVISISIPVPAVAQQDNLAAEVKQIFRTRCLECHGDTRREADINILDLSTFVGAERSVVPGNVDDSVLYDYIASDDEDFRMPEAPRPPLTTGEIETIRKWIEAKAPAFPNDVPLPEEAKQDPALANTIGTEFVLTEILKFVEATPRKDRPFLRFFSSNHLLASGVTAEELVEQQHALAKAINHLSWMRDIVKPITVDKKSNTIFAVDIRKLGWQKSDVTPVSQQVLPGNETVDKYDLILLEYPYGIAFENSETFDRLWDVYLKPAGLIRPIPCLRIDWFISVATQSPLYEDLLELPHELDQLEQLIGVDSESNLSSFTAARAGMTLSGVSRNNRIVERHPSRNGAYWKSYDFQTSKGLQNMFADPLDFHYAGGEMIWNLPNGLQAYLITDNAGKRILEAPTTIVTDKFSEDRVVRNGLACMRCHDRGMKRFADNIRPAFQSLPDRTGMNKQEILKLYIDKPAMDELLDQDEQRFQTAMEQALGGTVKHEPLTATTRKFLDAPLTLTQAAAELGLKEPGQLNAVFKLPQFTQLGLAGLSTGGVIRRDTWEDYYDRVVRQLGIGTPVAAVDGLTRPDHLAEGLAQNLKVSTNKKGNTFSPGDEMVITIKNETGVDLFIELVGTSARGRKVALTKQVLPLKNGTVYRFPETGAIKIQPQLGTEFITVFASPRKFAPGVLLRGENVGDRFIHDFYSYDHNQSRFKNNPSQLIKKTLNIETR
ncbi:MAG: hypothetical protein KDA70_08515 [Planctomycetaceae bacterium]|nr:hypothetical protein [Planctomycetaceae bacterium]